MLEIKEILECTENVHFLSGWGMSNLSLGGSPGAPGACVQGGIWPGRQAEEVIRLRKILGELVLSKNTKEFLAWISREGPGCRQ